MASTDRYALQRDAIGSVEIFGLIAATEVADVMLKTANVRIKSISNADAGIISVICEGDLAACRAAVDAGKAAGARLDALLGSTLIGRPFADTSALISSHAGTMFETAKPAAPRRARGKKK
jgi:microcompartment protein CcmL/EutN